MERPDITTTDRFGGLRALLQKTPSEAVWREIVDELALWDEGERERVALPYVSDHLDRWPVEIERGSRKYSGEAWMAQLCNILPNNEPEQVAALAQDAVRAARCRHIWISTSVQAEALLPHLGSFGRLTTLRIDGYKMDGELLCALMRHAWAPGLRELWVNGLSHIHKDTRRRIIEAMAQNPALEGLDALHLPYGALGGARIKALLSSPLARRLRALDLTGNVLDAGSARELLELPALDALETLRLGFCKIDAASARLLAQSALWETITSLDVSGNPLNEGLAALLSSPHTRALTTLATQRVRLEPAGARALCDVEWPPRLAAFDLNQVHLSGHTAAALADAPILRLMRRFEWHGRQADQPTRLLESPHLTGLRELELHHGADALIAATRNPALRGLETLSIHVQRADEAIVAALRQSVFCDTLRHLTLDAKRGGISGLVAPGAWRGLRHLGLGGRAHDDRAPVDSVLCDDVEVEQLAQSEALDGLESLVLSKNRLTDMAAVALADSGRLGALRTLDLRNNRIGPRGVRALIERGGLERLESLDLSYNPIGDEGAALLATDAVPAALFCEIVKSGLDWAGIGLAGARALLRSPHIGLATRLELSDRALTAEDLAQLAQDPALANLRGALQLRIQSADEAAWLLLVRSPYASQPTRDYAQQAINTLRYYAQQAQSRTQT